MNNLREPKRDVKASGRLASRCRRRTIGVASGSQGKLAVRAAFGLEMLGVAMRNLQQRD